MYLSATLVLVTQWLILITAIPIPNSKSLEAGLQARQFEIFANTDDSGALYSVGTPVAGTNTYRDSDGLYHDIPRRGENEGSTKPETKGSAIASSLAATTKGGSLWTRAQPASLAARTHENPKHVTDKAEESLAISERELGEEASAEKAALDGVLEKLDKGERIYF